MPSDISFHVDGLPWLIMPSRYPSEDYASATEASGFVLATYFQRKENPIDVKVGWGMKLASLLEHEAQGQNSGVFLWMTEPLKPPPLVLAELHPVQGTIEETHPLIGGAPHGEPFSVPGLGDGTRFDSSEPFRKGLFGKATRYTARWVWRIDDRDLLVTLQRDDAESFARMLPDVEALLAAATVTH